MMRRISLSLLALVVVVAGVTPAFAQNAGRGIRLGARFGDRAQGVRVRVNYGGNADGGKLFKVMIRGRDLRAGRATIAGCGSSWVVDLAAHGRGDNPGVGGKLVLSARRGDTVPNCSEGDSILVSRPAGFRVSGTLQARGGRGPRE